MKPATKDYGGMGNDRDRCARMGVGTGHPASKKRGHGRGGSGAKKMAAVQGGDCDQERITVCCLQTLG